MEEITLFESLIEEFSAEIYAYLWRWLRAPEDAEDCLQETFLRAFRAFPELMWDQNTDSPPNYRAWLYKIATNVTNTHLKRTSRHNSRTVELGDTIPSLAASPAEIVEMRLSLTAVRQAVDRLPEKQRAALLMRKYQHLDYAEIALALDCSHDAARANVYQALKQLRSQFQATIRSEKESR